MGARVGDAILRAVLEALGDALVGSFSGASIQQGLDRWPSTVTGRALSRAHRGTPRSPLQASGQQP